MSPGTAANDRGRKIRLLARSGVTEYWLVEPQDGTSEIYRATGDQFVLAQRAGGTEAVESPLLPALLLRPTDLVRQLVG